MSLSSPEGKWEHITTNFLFGLPRMPSGYNGIWVVVDRFIKTARAILIKQSLPLDKLATLYIDKIVSQYRTPMFIVSERDS